MKKVKWVLFGLVLLTLAVIVLCNLDETKVELVVATITMPLAALLTATLLIGFFLGIFASALWKVKNWRAKAKAKESSGSFAAKASE